jgi:hypothetical protein
MKELKMKELRISGSLPYEIVCSISGNSLFFRLKLKK